MRKLEEASVPMITIHDLESEKSDSKTEQCLPVNYSYIIHISGLRCSFFSLIVHFTY